MKRHLIAASFAGLALVGLTSANSYAQAAPPGDPIQLLAWLKGNVILIQLLVGIVWKYAPFMKSFSNQLIPWVNVAVFVISVFAGIAVAADSTAVAHAVAHHPSFFAAVFLGFIHSGVAKVLYDGWLKPALDNTLGKAVGAI